MLSRAPEVKRAIFNALTTALDGDGDVTVWLGQPTPETNPYEYVIVGPEDTPMTVSQEWRGLGSRTEMIDVPIEIEVFRDGDNAADAEDRSWEIATAVADLLADKSTFDPTVFSGHPSALSQVTRAFSNGRASTITITVHAEAVTRGI
jgi:hypothetical protein